MNIAPFVLKRSKVIIFVVLAGAALGIRSYLIAPQSIFPGMSFARIDVVAEAGDLTPERVRLTVTRPLETAFGTLPSAIRVRSTSSQGSAEIVVDFDTNTDPRVDLQYVEAAISSVQPTLPAAKRIEAVVVNPNAEPVVSYALTSRVLSQAALEAFVTTRIVPTFAGTPGLGRTSVVGGPPIEYLVELSPASLAALNLSAADVASAIADAGNVASVGTAERYHQRSVILIDAAIGNARALAQVGIKLKSGGSVALGTLGTVRLGVGPAVSQASVNGVHAVILNAFPLAGADAVSLAHAFDARLNAGRETLPADVKIVKYWDQTRLIVNSQTSLRDAILLGALLAIAVISAFLRSLRLTLVAAAIIPLALALAILALERSGQSLNLMSVGGLAIAVGLIIDDAIVVIEAIARAIAQHPTAARSETIGAVVGRITGAMTASTITTVVVFIPLGLLSGVSGFFFRALAFTLSVALLVSLVLALSVAPILANALLRGAPPTAERADRLLAAYEPILRWALGHRLAVFVGAGMVLVTTVTLMAQLPTDFLPKLDEGQFEIKYAMPPGATLADSDAAASRMERAVIADPAVQSVGRLTGVDTNGFSPTQAGTGTLRITLHAGNRAAYVVVAERLRNALTAIVPAANLDFHQLLEDQINDLSGTPQPVEIAISGPDASTLITYADKTADAIAKVPGVVDAFDGVIYDDASVRVVPQRAGLAAMGLSAGDLDAALSARTQGTIATQISGETSTIPVNVRVAGTTGAGGIADTLLLTGAGAAPLGALARVDRPARASDVSEENGRRIVRVAANIEGAALSPVVAGLKASLARLGLPPGYTATLGGAYETQQASFREFSSVIAIAVVLVFTVMLATFGSLRLPLVILCTIPLALVGVAAGLFLTRTPINVSSFMGLLLLVGIVVKNGILLIDVANKRRAAGDDVKIALVSAGSTRLRPIVMTTLAAIGGLIPLALGLGSGAEMERPLAIAVIGGLSTATVFTLVLIPVLYATFLGGGSRRSIAGRAAPAGLMLLVFLSPPAAGAQAVSPPSISTTSNASNMSTTANVSSTSVSSTSQLSSTSNVSSTSSASTVGDGVSALRFERVGVEAAQQLAVIASPDVRVARAMLAFARAGLGGARAATGLSLVGGYAEAPQGAPDGTLAQRLTSYGAQLNLGDVAAYDPLVTQAAANVRAAEADEIAAERTERIKTVNLYYAALKARAVDHARVDAVDSAQRQLDAARVRFDAGDAPRLDIVRAQVGLARAQGDLAAAKADDGSATDALAREVDHSPEAFASTIPEPSAGNPEVPTPRDAAARALAHRMDVLAAESNVRASGAGVAAARRGVFPAVSVTAGYASGIDSGFRTNGPTLSAQISIPLSGGAARVQAQSALLDAAQARRDGVARTVAVEAAAAARTASASLEAQAAATVALEAAKAELDAATLGYDHGALTSLELSTSRASYVQAVVDALSATYERLQAQAVLALEVGS